MLLKKLKYFPLFFLLLITKVSALEITRPTCIDGESIYQESSKFLTRTSTCLLYQVDNNHILYRIKPYQDDYVNKTYYYDNIYNQTTLDNDTLHKIAIIANNGYLHNGLDDIKWYSVTQYLILKTVMPSNGKLYYVDSNMYINETKYQEEIKYLSNIVNNILDSEKNITVDLSDTEEYVIDSNDYVITNMDSDVTLIDGKYHFKKPNITKTYILEKGNNDSYKILYNENNQYIDVYDTPYSRKEITLESNNSILYVEVSNYLSNNNTLSDNVYSIYTMDNNLVGEYTFKEGGKYTIYLPKNKYYVKMTKTAFNTKFLENYISFDLTNKDSYTYFANIMYYTYNYQATLVNKDNKPLKNIDVIFKSDLGEYHTTSDKNGLIDIDLDPNNYEVFINSDSYLLDSYNITLDKDINDGYITLDKGYTINIVSNIDTNVCLDNICKDTIDKKISFLTNDGNHTLTYLEKDGYTLNNYTKDIDVTRGRTIKINYIEETLYNLDITSNIDTNICIDSKCIDTIDKKISLNNMKGIYKIKLSNIEGYTLDNNEIEVNIDKDTSLNIMYKKIINNVDNTNYEEISVPNTYANTYYSLVVGFVYIIKKIIGNI